MPPPVVKVKPRITCPICGVSILRKGKKRHERSKRHQTARRRCRRLEGGRFSKSVDPWHDLKTRRGHEDKICRRRREFELLSLQRELFFLLRFFCDSDGLAQASRDDRRQTSASQLRQGSACANYRRASSSTPRIAAPPTARQSSRPAPPSHTICRTGGTRQHTRFLFCASQDLFSLRRSKPACRPAACRKVESNHHRPDGCSRTRWVCQSSSGRRCHGCKCSGHGNPRCRRD